MEFQQFQRSFKFKIEEKMIVISEIAVGEQSSG